MMRELRSLGYRVHLIDAGAVRVSDFRPWLITAA